MDLIIESYPKEHFLLIESKGKLISAEELVLQSQMILDEVAKYNYKKILVNQTKTELPLNLVPYFDLIKSYAESFTQEVREAEILVVVKKKYKVLGESWETICQSNGLNCHVFTSLKKAEKYMIDGEDER